MKALLLVTLLAALSSKAMANQSVEIWQKYYPQTDCEVNHCAKSVPPDALEAFLEKSVDYYPEKLETTKWMFLSDFTQNSKFKRGYLIRTVTGEVTQYHVAHGLNSGDGKGNAIRFSNVVDSKTSSIGLYLTAETYYGQHGLSLKLDGLEASNDKARERFIVIHGADYMSEDYVRRNGRAGRSWGCPAVSMEVVKDLIEKLKGGSLYYIYGK